MLGCRRRPGPARAPRSRSACPPAQSRVLSPSAPACVAQDHLEAVLLEHVATYECVTLRRGVTVEHVASTGAGATVTVHESTGGRTIAADRGGRRGRSAQRVRGALGIEMVGPTDLFEGFRIEFRAPLWEVLGEHRHCCTSRASPERKRAAARRTGRQVAAGLPAGSASDPSSDPSAADSRTSSAGSPACPTSTCRIERTGDFSAAAQLAERFSSGNVFIVGDAAHRVTPRGGTGLNTAIASGHDLGWKLAWVQRGWAPESLLATYEAERRPHAAHNVARSADPSGSRRGAATELDVDLGGRIRHVWTAGGHLDARPGGGGPDPVLQPGRRAWRRRPGAPGPVPVTCGRCSRRRPRARLWDRRARCWSGPTGCPPAGGRPRSARRPVCGPRSAIRPSRRPCSPRDSRAAGRARGRRGRRPLHADRDLRISFADAERHRAPRRREPPGARGVRDRAHPRRGHRAVRRQARGPRPGGRRPVRARRHPPLAGGVAAVGEHDLERAFHRRERRAGSEVRLH